MQNVVAHLMPRHYSRLDLLKQIMRNVSRFCLHAHTLAVEPFILQLEMETATSALVLLCKMRCTIFFTVKTCLRALSNANSFLSCLSSSPTLWRPLVFCTLCLVRLSSISFLSGTTNSAILSQTCWISFWLAKTSN